MASLDIRPHSPRVSGWAVAGLMLLGAGAFAAGIVHQLAPNGPPPFPPPQQASLRIADATPAPAAPLPVERPTRREAPPPEADAPPRLDLAQPAPGADASATAPDTAAAPPAEPPAPEPRTPEPRTPEPPTPELQSPQAPPPGDADPPA